MAFVHLSSLRLFPVLSSTLQPLRVNRCHTNIYRQRSYSTMAMASIRTDSELVNDVLTHWFGSTEVGRYDPMKNQYGLWYGSTEEIDNDIRDKFGNDVERALNGELDHLILSDPTTFKPDLALTILLDQYARNIFRKNAKAFKGDSKTRVIAHQIVSDERWSTVREKLSPVQCFSFLLPLMHQEHLEDLDLCINKTKDIVEDCKKAGPEASECLKAAEETVDFGIRHRDIVAQFGRYPHRNESLGRKSTPEEEKFLVEGPRFGQ